MSFFGNKTQKRLFVINKTCHLSTKTPYLPSVYLCFTNLQLYLLELKTKFTN